VILIVSYYYYSALIVTLKYLEKLSITINAYATGSEAITPPCRHLTQDAIVLKNKVQEILHGISVIILFLIS
jgi:hypothetical protein